MLTAFEKEKRVYKKKKKKRKKKTTYTEQATK